MVRIAGVDLPNSKKLEYALTTIYGIGLTTSKDIITFAKVDPSKRMHELDNTELRKIREIIENKYKVEDDLKRVTKQNIVRLSQINCVRGRRHRQNLPVRGQRTRTNSRTRRQTRLF